MKQDFLASLWRFALRIEEHSLAYIGLIIVGAFVIWRVFLERERIKKEEHIELIDKTVSVDGSIALPVREYISDIQGLAGKPDAIIKEDGFLIPVERKPMAKKLRDRHVAQLLVYMRLVEEFEGKRPPYGYLLLGPKGRKVRVANTEEKQAWLTKLLAEMQEVVAGSDAKATPEERKCDQCYVKHACQYRVL